MRIGRATGAVATALLVGCGGGGGEGGDDDGTPVTALKATMGRLPSGFSARYDAGSDTLILEDGANAVALQREARFEVPPYRLYSFRATGRSARVLRAETASGGGISGVALWQGGTGLAGPFHARLSDTQLPSEGSATFTGDYAAIVERDLNFNFFVKGAAAFSADFGTNTISGTITNRADSTEPRATFADIALAPAAIVNGSFAGTAGGGAGTGALGTTVQPGAYAGLFTGANGQELVGGIVIAHETVATRTPLTEHGAFIAERAAP